MPEVQTAEDAVEQLRAYFADRREVIAVYLFGSFAMDKPASGSDVDVAVLQNPIRDRAARLRLRIRYATELERLLGRSVDVVLLRDTGDTLSEEILRQGTVVHEADRNQHVTWRASRILRCLDFHPTRHKLEKGLSAAVRRQSHGP